MKRTCVLASVFALLTLTVYAGGPANKATGSVIRVRAGTDPATAAGWQFNFTAHEKVEMRNGKTRAAKGMQTAYMVGDSSRYWAIDVKCVNVLDEYEAVFAGEVVMTSGLNRVNRGDYVKVWVQDYGEPGAGADMLFTSRTSPNDVDVVADAIDFCQTPENHFDSMIPWDVAEGNIQVHYRD
jgi:hypothetical protein